MIVKNYCCMQFYKKSCPLEMLHNFRSYRLVDYGENEADLLYQLNSIVFYDLPPLRNVLEYKSNRTVFGEQNHQNIFVVLNLSRDGRCFLFSSSIIKLKMGSLTEGLVSGVGEIVNTFKLNSSQLRNVTLVELSNMDTWNFERYQFHAWRHWMGQNWIASVYISIAYVFLIFLGQRFMRNREPFNLHGLGLAWNFWLGLGCFMGFYRALPEVIHVYNGPDGVHRSLCIFNEHTSRAAFWGLLNIMSRVLELGGTAFIILKKKPLIFLHWYHHVTVLIYSWYFYESYEISLRVFGIVNSFVHSVVYFYFVLKGLGVKMPRKLAMFLTAVQLSEMFFGIAVNLYNLNMKNRGIECHREYASIYAAFTMYATYFILFAKLFRDAYLRKPSKLKRQ
ncbi:unnamed protein product [Allacma fusca]|uniref:Elongation of very long chain fatty acids protein n=1 Tax=Allacma fusca TaxID=39272 RepID=A0A8J2L2I8_9HEXA|nr:unnamed protein product [Allacma fusca]